MAIFGCFNYSSLPAGGSSLTLQLIILTRKTLTMHIMCVVSLEPYLYLCESSVMNVFWVGVDVFPSPGSTQFRMDRSGEKVIQQDSWVRVELVFGCLLALSLVLVLWLLPFGFSSQDMLLLRQTTCIQGLLSFSKTSSSSLGKKRDSLISIFLMLILLSFLVQQISALQVRTDGRPLELTREL